MKQQILNYKNIIGWTLIVSALAFLGFEMYKRYVQNAPLHDNLLEDFLIPISNTLIGIVFLVQKKKSKEQ